MVCVHNVRGCIVCMVDDFYDWRDGRAERYQARKSTWRETPVHERFDLGGEA